MSEIKRKIELSVRFMFFVLERFCGLEKGLWTRSTVADPLFVVDDCRRLLGFGSGLLGQKNGLDVWQNTTLGNGDAGEKLVQFFVIADSQLEMTRDDSALLVVTGGVTSQLEDLSCQVFHDGGQVDGCTRSDTFSVVSFPQETMDSSYREL